MGKSITWVAIDDHKFSLMVGVLRGAQRQEAATQTIANEDRAWRRWVRKLVRAAGGGEIRMCYEAGPNGFARKRRLEAMGPVVVEVMAPTLTPRQVGRRVKTDAIDARTLVKMFRGGELTPGRHHQGRESVPPLDVGASGVALPPSSVGRSAPPASTARPTRLGDRDR